MKVPHPHEKNPLTLAMAIRHLAEGRSNVAGQVTLTLNAATTTVTNSAIPAGCFPLLTPASANAAAEWGNGTIYVSAVAKGSFTITHANSATAGRTVNYYAVGG